ncbi:hypothetical protein LXL04_024882 [Taraxacum kok-saghyz]
MPPELIKAPQLRSFENSYIPENPRTPPISYISQTVIHFKKPTLGLFKTFLSAFETKKLIYSREPENSPNFLYLPNRYSFQKTDFGTLQNMLVQVRTIIKFENGGTNLDKYKSHGYDYSSGVWQFEAYGYVPCGTTGVSIMQVFGSAPPTATTTMLRVYNSSLYYYKDPMIIGDLYNKWFRFNVIHDVKGNTIKVYVDGVLKYEGDGHGGTSHYFKCGVYTQDHASFYMESRWKNIKVFEKCGFIFLSTHIIGTCSKTINDLSSGFTCLPFNTSYYKNHKPYNLPLEERYSLINGVHKLWVFSTDEPMSRGSPTLPRSELFINGYVYSSGVWQFEAGVFVPCGTTGVSVMQVFGSDPPHTTTTMLRVYNGTLYYYRKDVILHNIYDKWFRLNVIHDVEGNNVKVYINGVFKFKGDGRGGTTHYFKFGVYAQDNAAFYMESRWKHIKIFKKSN